MILVRHGESEGNVDYQVHRDQADHTIALSSRGHLQAKEAAEKIQNHLRNNKLIISANPKVRLWSSPYLRTKQTAEAILPIEWEDKELIINDYKEDVALSEQQFGLFDGLNDQELETNFPKEYAHYDKQERHMGRFWARMPCGESRFDVVMRVHQAFGTWQRDAERNGIRNIIVVSHGVTIRAIVMRWCHYSTDWFEREPNPPNASVRIIRNGNDLGYI